MLVKLLFIAATGIALSGCAGGLPGMAGSSFDINGFLNSTTCSHDDEVNGVTGAAGVPASLQFKVARHCPAVTPPMATGTVVAPAPASTP